MASSAKRLTQNITPACLELFKPQPGPQTAAFECPARELLYGGAKFTGKSWYLLIDFYQDVERFGVNWNGIIFRRTVPELADLKRKARKLYPLVGATWNETKGMWTFPNGAELSMKYLKSEEEALTSYWGHEYCWVGIDELPNWETYEMYETVRSNCRTAHPGAAKRKRIRCTGNPGGPGHFWVRHTLLILLNLII